MTTAGRGVAADSQLCRCRRGECAGGTGARTKIPFCVKMQANGEIFLQISLI